MDGLPYIDVPLSFGPIQTFGILMALGVLFGSWLARKYVERNGLDEEVLRWLGIRLIVWGFVGAFALNTLFYEWDRLVDDPWGTIKGLGISSYGAIVASAAAFFYYTHVKKLDRRAWADMAAWGAAGGWVLGRLGCAVVHDHLGHKTDSPFGVNVPPFRYPFDREAEVIRAHDLGLYEFFLWVVLLAAVILLERWKGRRPGFLLGFLAVAYSIPRFFFENLRFSQTDPRYAGLTFAQWSSIAFFAWGLWLIFGPVKRAEAVPEARAAFGGEEEAAGGGRGAGGGKKKKKKRRA